MTLHELKRRLKILETALRECVKKERPQLTAEAADIIRRELLYGEEPKHFTKAQVRAFTEMVVKDLPHPPKGWYRD